ncbi:MAG: nuclear transport factor 2 family protein [Gemmatimonadota bacterium]|nr:nuclear transport factor 2 family protein [Gemmatimonadota bacterium]
MKKTVIAVFAAASACTAAPEAPEDSARLRSEVEAFLESYRAAADEPDTAALRTMYVDDGRFEWIEDGRVSYDSPDAVLAAIAGLSGSFRMETEYDRVVVKPVGNDGAVAAMRFVTSMGEGSATYAFSGMVTLVIERGPAGWQIVTGHASTARPDGR